MQRKVKNIFKSRFYFIYNIAFNCQNDVPKLFTVNAALKGALFHNKF